MGRWTRWMAGAVTAAALVGTPALAQYADMPAPPPGLGTYQYQYQGQDWAGEGEGEDLDFRGALSPYGEWIFIQGVGEVWRPYQQIVGADFQPYVTHGRWIYTDYGWSWVSDYNWGWAPFHYGRWTYRPRWGWVWRPGRVWAPAWVEWRYGAGYIGWSALTSDELAAVDVTFRSAWCFVDTMNFVSSRLHTVMLPWERSRVAFGATTPLSRRHSYEGRWYNEGPPRVHVARAVGRDIRPETPDFRGPGRWRRAGPPSQGYVPAPPRGQPTGGGFGRVPPPPPAGQAGGFWEGQQRRDDHRGRWEDRQERRDERQESHPRWERRDEPREHRAAPQGNWVQERKERAAQAAEEREQRQEERRDSRGESGPPRGKGRDRF